MSISTRLKELLDEGSFVYEQRVRPVDDIPGNEIAKTVIVNADGLLRMAVLPANRMLDLRHLKFITRAENIRLANESELEKEFPSCEAGAIPPVGSLFGLPVYCDVQLEHYDFIEFHAGTQRDTIRMAFRDFKQLSNPTMTDLVDHSKQAA